MPLPCHINKESFTVVSAGSSRACRRRLSPSVPCCVPIGHLGDRSFPTRASCSSVIPRISARRVTCSGLSSLRFPRSICETYSRVNPQRSASSSCFHLCCSRQARTSCPKALWSIDTSHSSNKVTQCYICVITHFLILHYIGITFKRQCYYRVSRVKYLQYERMCLFIILATSFCKGVATPFRTSVW